MSLVVILAGACGAGNDPHGITERAELSDRELSLPTMEGGSRPLAAGECLRGERAGGAIAVPGLRKEAALGPWPGEATLESGPVYVALLAGPPRIALLSSAERIKSSRSPWAMAGVVVSRPEYRGPLLLRGGSLAPPHVRLHFGRDVEPQQERILPAGEWNSAGVPMRDGGLPGGWPGQRVAIRVPGPGCYAIQVDGERFSYALPFGVQRG